MKKKKFVNGFIKVYPADLDLSKDWFLYWNINGKRYKRKGRINRFPSVKDRLEYAEILAEDIMNDLKGKKAPPKNNELNFLFTQAISKLSIKPKTIKSYVTVANHFSQFCLLHIKKIDKKAILAYQSYLKNERNLNPTTVNFHITTLKNLFNVLIDEAIIFVNPTNGVKRLKAYKIGYDYFRPHHIARIKEEIEENDPQLWLACQLTYYCFLRNKSESPSLQIKHIDLYDNKILVPANIAKNSKNQYVAIPAPLRTELEKWNIYKYPDNYYLLGAYGQPSSKRVGMNYFTRRHRAVLNRLHIDTERFKMYSWKHTGAIALVKAGVNLKSIQLQLRHHSLDQVNQYFAKLGVNFDESVITDFPTI